MSEILDNRKIARCTILGCGGSDGVPQIGCNCYVCTSDLAENCRTRSSIMIETPQVRVIIDPSPDLRYHMLRHGVSYLDGVFITHPHNDHIAGIGDLKLLGKQKNTLVRKSIPVITDKKTAADLERSFPHLFKCKDPLYPAIAKLIPQSGSFTFYDLPVISVWQKHGNYFSYTFRFGGLAYSTDVSAFNDDVYRVLEGIDVWIIDCLRYSYAPTHMSLERALWESSVIAPKKCTILTHMSHEIEYESISKLLPDNVQAAKDGYSFEFFI